MTHLPLPLKIWLGRGLLQVLSQQYLQVEQRLLWSRLIELETKLLEEALPIPSVNTETDGTSTGSEHIVEAAAESL